MKELKTPEKTVTNDNNVLSPERVKKIESKNENIIKFNNLLIFKSWTLRCQVGSKAHNPVGLLFVPLNSSKVKWQRPVNSISCPSLAHTQLIQFALSNLLRIKKRIIVKNWSCNFLRY